MNRYSPVAPASSPARPLTGLEVTPLTEALRPLADCQGYDLTSFALRERALTDMEQAFLSRDDVAYEQAKDRFDSLAVGLGR